MLVEQVLTVFNDLTKDFCDFYVEREILLDQNYYQGKFCVGDFFFLSFFFLFFFLSFQPKNST